MRSFFHRLRFSFRFFWTFVTKHQRLIIMGFFTGIIFFIAIPKVGPLFFTKNIQKIGLVGKYVAPNLPEEIESLISQGLTKVTPEGRVISSLADSWKVENEGKEYIFKLKDNLFWHDRSPIVAKDINYNFSDVTTEILDEKTIKFILKEPFAPFPQVVSRPIFKKAFIGTGEYKISQISQKGQVIEKALIISVKKPQKKILFRFYPTEEAARTAIKLGEIDELWQISDPGDFSAWTVIAINPRVMMNRFVGVFFNTQDEKLTEKSIRQGLTYAIQKNWPERALGPISSSSWSYNPAVKPYDYDLAKAKELLKKTESEQPQLTEIELSTLPILLKTAEEIKKDWEAVGVQTKIRVLNSLNEPYQALLAIQEIPDDPDQYVFWHSTQKLNLSHFKSPKIDKLLEDGRKTFDEEKRKEIYQDFQRFLVEDTPVAFLYHPTLYDLKKIPLLK